MKYVINKFVKGDTLEVTVEISVKGKAKDGKEYFTTSDLISLITEQYDIHSLTHCDHDKLSNAVGPGHHNKGKWQFRLIPRPTPVVETPDPQENKNQKPSRKPSRRQSSKSSRTRKKKE